ncbi:EAL domain-containing protein [Shewanella sp. VAX-SP0-0CM-1]|uniref:EAL domain-containing protein n=3 Tax=Shewanella TaxID=22 RepID=A0ABU9UWI4_9GAMM
MFFIFRKLLKFKLVVNLKCFTSLRMFFLFLSPLLCLFTFESSLKNITVDKMTTYVTKKIALSLHERESSIENMLKLLPKELSYNCRESDMLSIRNPKYYTQHIRVIGLVTDTGSCTSSGGVGAIDVIKNIYFQGDNGYYLLKTPSSGSEYIVLFKSIHGLVYAILSNYWIDDLVYSFCKNCFIVSVQASVNDHNITISKGRGYISRKLIPSNSISVGRLNLDVFATQLLNERVEYWYNKYVYLLSLIFGLMLVSVWHLIFFRKVSHKDIVFRAIKSNEFVPFYQPIVDIVSNEVVGFEVLARWRQLDGSFASPAHFICEIENDVNILHAFTSQIIEQVCNDKQKIRNKEFWFSVNIGAKHFVNENLLNYMRSIKNISHGISFEITERQPMHCLLEVAKYVDELRDLGHSIKIDDFGVGYGGFSYLQTINVDSIKIDKMFVDTIETVDAKSTILDSIISLAHENEYEIIAEGVETEAQIEYLKLKNVKYIQGYYFSPPVPFERLLELLH